MRAHLAESVRSKARFAILRPNAPPVRGFFLSWPMLRDLESLIQLQELENDAAAAQAKIDAIPARLDALDAGVAARADVVAGLKQRFDEHRVERQDIEKELAQVQARLTRFKEQLMEVKTNKEYQAMQSEISGGQQEVQRSEDKLLEQMLEADELAAEIRHAEQLLSEERSAADQGRAALEADREVLEKQLAHVGDKRSQLVGSVFARGDVPVRDAGATTEGHSRRPSPCRPLHVMPGEAAAAAVQ